MPQCARMSPEQSDAGTFWSMRYADTATLRLLNERAASDGLMCVAESVFEDVAPDGVHLCD